MEKFAFFPIPAAIAAGAGLAGGAGFLGFNKGKKKGAMQMADSMSGEFARQNAVENQAIIDSFNMMNQEENSVIEQSAFKKGVEYAMQKKSALNRITAEEVMANLSKARPKARILQEEVDKNLGRTVEKIVAEPAKKSGGVHIKLEPKTIDSANNALLDILHFARTGQSRPRMQHHYNTMIPKGNVSEISTSGEASGGIGKMLLPVGIGVAGGALGMHMLNKKSDEGQYKFAALYDESLDAAKQSYKNEAEFGDMLNKINKNKLEAAELAQKARYAKINANTSHISSIVGDIEKIVAAPFKIKDTIAEGLAKKHVATPLTLKHMLVPAAVGGAAALMPSLFMGNN